MGFIDFLPYIKIELPLEKSYLLISENREHLISRSMRQEVYSFFYKSVLNTFSLSICVKG